MRKMAAKWILAVALALLLPVAGPVDAQQRRPQQRPGRMEMEAQVRERFQRMVFRELGLTEEQGEAMAAVVAEFQEPRQELNRRQRALEQRMSGTGALLSESEARSVLEELVAVREQEVRILREEQDRLLEILTPPQLVRFYTLREQFAARIRQMRSNRPGGPPMGGGAPILGVW